ncbi:MAG: histidine kinase dimerization/phospho-acceptor domain-containing protein [Ignavibacteriaceae bacterium]|jgi:signal transduction histidine kinase
MREMSEREIAFIGKITAGVTHEINNALASIKEISGLMEDLISMSSTDSFPHQEKFAKILPKIREQVQRCVKLTTQLKKFSHLTDEYTAQVELNDFIEHLIFLTQRFARIKRVELQYQPADQAVNFNTIPIQLQMAIYYCITYFLSHTDDGGKIFIHPLINGEQYSINIKFEGEVLDKSKLFNDPSSKEELLILQDVISSLEGSVEFDGSAQSINLNLKERQENN